MESDSTGISDGHDGGSAYVVEWCVMLYMLWYVMAWHGIVIWCGVVWCQPNRQTDRCTEE